LIHVSVDFLFCDANEQTVTLHQESSEQNEQDVTIAQKEQSIFAHATSVTPIANPWEVETAEENERTVNIPQGGANEQAVTLHQDTKLTILEMFRSLSQGVSEAPR
jgi:hypothetical protein